MAVLLGAALAGRYGGRAEGAAALFFLLTLLVRALLIHVRPPLPLGCAIEGAWGGAALAAGYMASGRFPPCPPEIPYFLLAFMAFSSAKVLFDERPDMQGSGRPARSARERISGNSGWARPLACALFLPVLLAPVLWLGSRHAPWYVCAILPAVAAAIVALAFTSSGRKGPTSSALILWSLYLGALTLLVRLY